MKLEIVDGRWIADMTRLEALLIKDAILDFQNDRSETESWDSQVDPILVAQIKRVLDRVQ